jgi:hypothetical protein
MRRSHSPLVRANVPEFSRRTAETANVRRPSYWIHHAQIIPSIGQLENLQPIAFSIPEPMHLAHHRHLDLLIGRDPKWRIAGKALVKLAGPVSLEIDGIVQDQAGQGIEKARTKGETRGGLDSHSLLYAKSSSARGRKIRNPVHS